MVTQIIPTDVEWKSLTPDEKLEIRLEAWRAAEAVNFASAEAKAAYQERVSNIIDALRMKKPARLAILPDFRAFGATYCGYTAYELQDDIDKVINATKRLTLEFNLDTIASVGANQARVREILEDKTHVWPGHGLLEDAEGQQFLEGEYMKADEYDAFFADPSDYWLRTYLPRTWGAAEPFAKLTPLSRLNVSDFGRPEIQAALEKLMAAGREAIPWQQKMRAANRELTELGYPTIGGGGEGVEGGASGVPFVRFSDSLRGTKGIMTDMLKQPEKLLESMERLVQARIKNIKSARRTLGNCPIVTFHLHKGADRLMSEKLFRTFYWEPAHKIYLALIEEGFLVGMRLEGEYNSRLGILSDMPKGKAVWFVTADTDMARMKESIGQVGCIVGGVPPALLFAGTTDQIADYCRNLIEVAGKGGGYIFSMPIEGVPANTKVENVWASINTAKKYGSYR